MAAERLFYHQRIEDGVDLTMLMISIESAHQSLNFYDDRVENQEKDEDIRLKQAKRNPYGLALTEYQLGYLLEKHRDVLNSEEALSFTADNE